MPNSVFSLDLALGRIVQGKRDVHLFQFDGDRRTRADPAHLEEASLFAEPVQVTLFEALSRAAEKVIKQNVAVSILIKGAFVLLAPFGLVALWLAVLADMGTSLAVTLNGLRLFRRGRAK